MSDTARKMFPVETVLALAVAKKGADVKDIAGYITGRSIVCDACAAAVAPFAAAWLAKLSPKFLDMNYKDGDNWGDFVNQGARLLGDTISLTPMDDCLKNAVATVLDMMDDMHGTMVSQRAEIATLRQQVETLAPYQGKAEELQKKCDKLEDTIKTMKTDMGGLRRQVAEFQGKVAINHDELMQSIKDAIKDNLFDVAGVRVICNYRDDVYSVANYLSAQSDIQVLRVKDYIKNPKQNGYRSLHVIYAVPVFLSSGPHYTPVEVQLRTIAMDYWASLEHALRYKTDLPDAKLAEHSQTLLDCARSLQNIETQMQNIHRDINSAPRVGEAPQAD